jgi:DNA adenine methylase
MSVTVIHSPFRYPGGKFRARSVIRSLIPQHTYYAEPLAGGASIFFAKERVETNVLNDKDKDLINCYIHIRDHVEDLIAHLQGVEATREKYDYYKTKYQPGTDLERAVRWYYLNRTSFSGIMNPGNCYWGYNDECSMRPENWPAHLRRCSKKLQGVELTHDDFETVIKQAPKDAFLFVDPPYFGSGQARFYFHKFTKKEHSRLADVLKENCNRIRFLLSYNDCCEIRELYKWAGCHLQQEWQYTLARTDDQKITGNGVTAVSVNGNVKGKRTAGKELFILNYTPPTIETTITETSAEGEGDVEHQHCFTE